MKSKERKNTIKKTTVQGHISWFIACALAVFWLLITILPFIFMVLNSFKDKFEMLVKGIFQLPDTFNTTNYSAVLNGRFFHYFMNSIIVLTISLVVLLFISACAAYPLARFKFRLNGFIYGLIVACMSIPIHITLIPVFKLSKSIGLYDTIWALIGPYIAFGIPISVFILTDRKSTRLNSSH